MTITAATKQTIFLIAMDYWEEQGRTQDDISRLTKSQEGMNKFLKPAIKIYKNLNKKFLK